MSSATERRRFECLEPECGYVVEAETHEDLVERVQQHMADEHDTFELEDVILDNSTIVE